MIERTKLMFCLFKESDPRILIEAVSVFGALKISKIKDLEQVTEMDLAKAGASDRFINALGEKLFKDHKVNLAQTKLPTILSSEVTDTEVGDMILIVPPAHQTADQLETLLSKGIVMIGGSAPPSPADSRLKGRL